MVDSNEILNMLSKDIFSLGIFHHELRSKIDDLLRSMFPDLPHILCFS